MDSPSSKLNKSMIAYHETGDLFADTCEIVESAQSIAYAAVDIILVQRNWLLGKRIAIECLNENGKADYGKKTMKKLSAELKEKYGKGFDFSSLYKYVKFHQEFPQILDSLRPKSGRPLSWTHYRILLQETSAEARAWYAKEAQEQTWSVRTLQRNISSQYYYRMLMSQNAEPVEKEMKELIPMPTIAMVATRGKNDKKDMYDYLGDKKRTKTLENAFKQEYSNFRVVIVVDMWITGFDVPCLTYLYNDKPLQKHTLVQTVSRVNRKYPGKDFGYIIDYIGIRNNMMEAMKQYGGDTFGPSEDDVQQALEALLVELELIKQLFAGFDLKPFIDKDSKPLDRLECLGKASEHILTLSKMYNVAKEGKRPKEVDAKTFFLAHVKRLKTAYDICQPSNALNHEQLSLSQCFMCVATYIRKASGEKHDVESMNRVVQRMVAEALQCNSVVSILDTDVEESIFSPGFIEQLNGVKLPATRLEVLIKMLRRSIAQYKNTNKFAAEKFEELLKKTLEEYHNRRATLSSAEATQTQKDTVDEIIRNATQQALDILSKLGEDKESFRKLGLTFEEKAFYDILMHMRDVHNFEYGTDRKVGSLIINDKCKALAKKVKELIDTQSCFADWLSNTNVRAKLNQDLWFLLDENGYPPEWSDDVFDQVLDQVENYKEHQSAPRLYSVNTDYYPFMVAEP